MTNSVIGTLPNQVPRNHDLGKLAYMDDLPQGRVGLTATTVLVPQHNRQLLDITSGTFTLTSSGASVLGNGWSVVIRNVGTGIVTLPTVDGIVYTLGLNDSIRIICDGSALYSVSITRGRNYLQVRDEKSSGTDGGASLSGVNIRTLNTVVTNTINGASLASDIVTIPAGTYLFNARAPTNGGTRTQLSLYNHTDSSFIVVGDSCYDSGVVSVCICDGSFTITSSKGIKLSHNFQTAIAAGLGFPTNRGQAEVYASLQLWKIA